MDYNKVKQMSHKSGGTGGQSERGYENITKEELSSYGYISGQNAATCRMRPETGVGTW